MDAPPGQDSSGQLEILEPAVGAGSEHALVQPPLAQRRDPVRTLSTACGQATTGSGISRAASISMTRS